MSTTNKYPVLFSPAKIGSMTVKNRAVMAPMGTHSASADGNMNDKSIGMYAERAKGGVGAIIVGMIAVDEEHGVALPNQFRLKSAFLTEYSRLTEEIHSYDTRIIGQLYHGGAMSNPAVTGFINYSASDISIYPDRPTRAMTLDEIKRLREMYVEKALLLQRAGFDGAEIHAAHGYLLSQFLSPYHNRRTDDYGGSFENRFRLLREIIEDVRSAVGGRFVLTVRFPGDEFAKDRSPLHMDAEDGLRIAKAIEATGKVDALNISYGNAYNPNANCEPYSYKEGWKCETAKRIKDSVSLPTMSTNTIKGPELAEKVLEDGVSDFVVLGRSLLADPYFMKKAYTGREDDIRRCMGCMHCRAGMSSVGLQCAVNPTLMREVTHGSDKLRHDGNGTPVAVVGGGPAGMQAAQTLAKHGFDVTLYEKSDAMGGSMNAADKAPCKDKMTRMIGILERQTERAGVRLLRGCEADPELVAEGSPAAVFLACGARPIVPNLPGVTAPNVYLAEQVQRERVELKGRVAVIGGGMTGMEVAETLEERGCLVTLIEMAPTIGAGMAPQLVTDVKTRMKNTTVLVRHKLTAVTATGVACVDLETDRQVDVEADSVVLALGAVPDAERIGRFCDYFGTQTVYLVGDANSPGKIADATRDAYLKAFNFSL